MLSKGQIATTGAATITTVAALAVLHTATSPTDTVELTTDTTITITTERP